MRLFVALDVPEDVRAAIAEIMAKLRPASRAARWVRIEGVHITLKFIGEVSSDNAEGIKTSLADVLFPAPIAIHFRGLGFFPNERRPRVLWAGIQATESLAALAAAVEAALEPLGVARENRAFSPHLTLARFYPPRGTSAEHAGSRLKSLEALRAAIAQAGPLDFGGAVANEFHLYLSVLKRGGAEYTRVATFPCGGGESR